VILGLAALFAFLAAGIQRIAGIGFVLIFIAPAALMFGAHEGQTLTILLALVAAATALPTVWRDIDWRQSVRIVVPGLALAPAGVLIVNLLSHSWLMILTACLAIFALTVPHISALAPALRGNSGAIIAGATAGLMHTTAGLAGPPIAAYALGNKWEQRRSTASIQLMLAALGLVSITLRGMPASSPTTIITLAIATIAGIIVGALLAKRVPHQFARQGMLTLAWSGAITLLVRGLLTVLT